jgi:hypothetical protein
MTFTRSLLKYLLLAVIIFTACNSFAGGFPVRPGRLLLSPSIGYFFSDKEYDSTGTKKPFANDGKFTSVSINLYAEYGISRRWAVNASIPYTINNYTSTKGNFATSGFTDMETGIKYYLANINYQYYFAVQGTAITPLYSNPNLGYDEEGAELKLSFAGSGVVFDSNFYFNLDNGIRQYFGNQGPWQDRYNATFGLSLDKKFENQVSASFGGFYTQSDNKSFNVYNPTISKDFSFKQVSVSYGHAFNHEFSVLVTGGTFIAGRNTGAGSNVALGIVYRLWN